MKPKEFDDLLKNKFDQNDFAYNPRNWEQLSEQLDGRGKKRSIIAWLGLPLAGMAASVALAMGVTTLMRQGMPEKGSYAAGQQQIAMAAARPAVPQVPPGEPIKAQVTAAKAENKTPRKAANNNSIAATVNKKNTTGTANSGFHIKLSDKTFSMPATPDTRTAVITPGSSISIDNNSKSNNSNNNANNNPQNKKKIVLLSEAYSTFRDEPATRKPANVSVILSGGLSRGNRNSGYMAGATVRKMLNERVYVEGDVAFASTANVQTTSYAEQVAIPTAAARTTKVEAVSAAKVTGGDDLMAGGGLPPVSTTVIKQKDITYSMHYAQFTPSIGYKIMKKMSMGVGPDFQKALSDNRPAPSAVERGTIQVAPLFDIGLIGKTEYAITKQVKAAVVYRKGMNNALTPTMGKYIDRDYLQFQVKCTILNR